MSVFAELKIADLAMPGKWSLNGGPFGSKLVSSMYVDEGVPVIRGANLPMDQRFLDDSFVYVTEAKADELRAHTAAPGDVVFTQRGTLGQVGLIPREARHQRYVISQSQMKLTVDPSLADPGYVYYTFRAPQVIQRFVGLASTSGVPHVNLQTLRDFAIPVPPLETQQRIAAILGAYDDLIEVNRRRVAVLEEMARGLFEEWFVRFRFPGYEDVPIVDTPDGPLPDGWEWRPFSDLADFMNGFAFKPSHFQDDGLPIIKIPELKNGVSAKTPRNSGEEVPKKYWVNTGDLLFSWSGTFAISEWIGGLGLLNQHLFLVHPKPDVERGLLKAALRWAIPLFDNQGVGATMKHIRRSALDHTKVPYPTDEGSLGRANAIFRSTYELCTNIRCQIERLAASRDLLLPRLISGQLSIEAAERQLEDAA